MPCVAFFTKPMSGIRPYVSNQTLDPLFFDNSVSKWLPSKAQKNSNSENAGEIRTI